MDESNMDRDTPSRDRDRSIAAGFALLATAVSLVAVALITSGNTRIVSIAALGLLIPTVAIVASTIERRRVARRIETLKTELQDERESRDQLSRVFARFTDELRAPLTAVYGLSRHLDAAGISDIAEAEELIGVISHDATEIVRTVENTAVAAQIDSGTYRPRLVAIDLERHVLRTIGSIGRTPLEITTDARPVTVWCDPAAVRLMLLNVLHTAADGGAGAVRIDVDERNGLGILSVTDDRQRGHVQDGASGNLLGNGDTLSRGVVPALVASQGGTITTARTLGWSSTVIRIPMATPAQLSAPAGIVSTSGSPESA
ncbi:MAG: hypothetical protein U9N78_04235 [Actinomycetota bacterium]|nr:hypothetical protein [Actinomycetota bacterium]